MTLTSDDILPDMRDSEVVHWMKPGPLRIGTAGLSATAAAAFALGVAAATGGFLLYRYLNPRKEALPPWRWGRGPLH